MSKITIINITIGLWWGISYILMFAFFRAGHSISEPSVILATIEIVVASIFTGWFVWQLPYRLIKANKERR